MKPNASQELKDSIFVEKYRPETLDDVVLDPKLKQKLERYLKRPKSIPHFLFYSRVPGTGKTTTALAICRHLGCDLLIINSSDDRTIDVVRERVKTFALSLSSQQELKRCVFMDEFDGCTKQSQDALRNIFETYSANCFFILTCNHLEKVIEPIQSRCIVLNFSLPDKEFLKNRLVRILEREGMNDRGGILDSLIQKFYPDIRSMISSIQDMKISGSTDIHVLDKAYIITWKLLLAGSFDKIRMRIANGIIQPELMNKWIFDNVISSKKLTFRQRSSIIKILADNERDFAFSVDKAIIFMASVLRMMRVIIDQEDED